MLIKEIKLIGAFEGLNQLVYLKSFVQKKPFGSQYGQIFSDFLRFFLLPELLCCQNFCEVRKIQVKILVCGTGGNKLFFR